MIMALFVGDAKRQGYFREEGICRRIGIFRHVEFKAVDTRVEQAAIVEAANAPICIRD